MSERDRSVQSLVEAFARAQTLKSLPPIVDVLREAPPNPPEDIQAQFVGASYKVAYAEAGSFVRVADEWSTRRRGRGLAASSRVVDFGSGWGRIVRMLLAQVEPARLYALDVDQGMTALVNVTIPGINALTVNPLPPTVLGDATVDTVTAFSVFSHLSPDAHEAWAREFGRIVRPSGMVFLTVLDATFFDQVEGMQKAVAGGSEDTFALSLAQCFPDLADVRARFKAGEPAYAGLGGGGVRTGDYYGWAAIPKVFVERVWGDAGFDITEWVPSGTLFPQAMVGLVRREPGAEPGKTVRPARRWRQFLAGRK